MTLLSEITNVGVSELRPPSLAKYKISWLGARLIYST